jgi:ATP-dependent RNA helicase DeaD
MEVTVGEVPAGGGSVGSDRADPSGQRGRVFLSLGEQDGADVGKVREAVQALSPGLELLNVELRRTHSYLEVEGGAVDGVVAALDGKEWNGKRLGAERARRRRR